MRKQVIVVCTVAVLTLSGLSSASNTLDIVQKKQYCGIPSLLETFTFDQFNDLNGTRTLQSILVSMTLDVDGGNFILDNDGEKEASGQFEFGATGSISSSDVDLLDSFLLPITAEVQAVHSDSFTLASNIGDVPYDFDKSAPDGMQYLGGPESDSGWDFVSSTLLNQYIGTGTFTIDMEVIQKAEFGGVSGIEWAVTPVNACGEVSLTYTYIPEPATVVLMGLSSFFIYRRRRG